MDYVIGIDIGTSGAKSVLFTDTGKVVASFLYEYSIISKNPMYAEESPFDWYNAVLLGLKKIGEIKLEGKILSIGLTGQMHGLVLLDKQDKILRDSIIWCDNRTANEALDIENKLGKEKVKRITGNIPMPQFTLAKLLWVKKNEPEIYKNVAKVLLPKDYIRYMLTGRFYSEYSDASGTQMLDINTFNYSKEILDAFEIPVYLLPKLVKSTDNTGYLKESISEYTKIDSIPVCGGASDQASGAIGLGVVSPSDISIVLGSSGVCFAPIEKLSISKNGEYQTFIHATGDYHIMGVTNGAGTSLKWFANNLCQDIKKEALNENKGVYELISDGASLVKAGSNGLFYLPYLMGERTPHLDPYATGVFLGIRNTTTKYQMARAVMEGVSYSLLDCYNLIETEKRNVYITGGGAKSKVWKSIIASMFKTNIIEIDALEGSALGAAILALVSVNKYKTIKEACNSIIKIKGVTGPNKEESIVYDKNYSIYKKLYLDNKNTFKLIYEENK